MTKPQMRWKRIRQSGSTVCELLYPNGLVFAVVRPHGAGWIGEETWAEIETRAETFRTMREAVAAVSAWQRG